MTRWVPHEYFKEGQRLGFNKGYLSCLVDHGRAIQEKNTPVIFTLSHLAHCSRTLYSDLHAYIAIKVPTKDFPYRHFPIKKRSGGTRWISVPDPPLWAAQAWISRNILRNIAPHNCSTAYAPGCSPKKNAEIHCGSTWLLKLDVENFFGNISERQVFHVFRKQNYPPLLSFEMARLCTKFGKHVSDKRVGKGCKSKRWKPSQKGYAVEEYQRDWVGVLPQGAPSSPMLSNLVAYDMDEELYQLATKERATYTRYADDLIFSFLEMDREKLVEFKKKAIAIVRKQGFPINSRKSKIIPPGARKLVTGLVVNDSTPKIRKEVRDKIRAHLFYSKKFGVSQHCTKRGFSRPLKN